MAEENEHKVYGTRPEDATTAFARRNPLLAAFIPDFMENAVDALIPDSLEAKMERSAQKAARHYSTFTSDFNAGFGEVAASLLRVCKYAFKRFGISDLVFGIYHLAKHHASTNAEDSIEGIPVTNATVLKWLLYCTNLSMAAYCPTVEEFAAAAKCKPEDILELQPKTASARPAYALGVDHVARQVVLAFRGTTDLNDMLTDACAACVPYCGGQAHHGMLKAARWFVKHRLQKLRELCDANPGYGLLLVGHSLGAGTACMLAHLIRKGDPEAGQLMKGIKLHAVGIATPAVLSYELAEDCNSFISSVVLAHDIVPRFSVYNAFVLKEEMDATKWSEKLAATAADWAVPDVIEHSETYKKLVRSSRRGLYSVMHMLAVWWLSMLEWFVSLLYFVGVLKHKSVAGGAEDSDSDTDEDEVVQATAAAAAQGGTKEEEQQQHTTLRDVARSTAKAVGLVLHHPSLAAETIAAIEKACAEAAQGDVHALVAPGRLYYMKRRDPPKEEQEALRKAAADAQAAREAARKAAAAARKEGAEIEEAEVESSEEEEDPYPGSSFELIRGGKDQRFKRIVLQETCLMDHMCGCYVHGVQQLLNKYGGQASKEAE